MMLSKSFFAVALAGAATAVTPSGFQPASNSDLIVAFGNTLALNGKSMTKAGSLLHLSSIHTSHIKAETASEPIIGTTTRLTGTYAIMMVDPDIPPQTVGGPTGELLHWMQQGLTSSNTSTLIGGMQVFVLRSATNETAIAPYFGPSPPNKAPNTHRYTQLLLDTTGNANALASLKTAGATRTNFNAVNVVSQAGVNIIAGNSFDVTNGTANATATTSTQTSNGTASGGTIPASAPINSATIVQANITKTNPTLAAGGASASGTVPVASSSNGTNGTTGTAVNGTSGAPGTRGLGQSGGGAYIAGLLALAAALFLL